MRQMKKIKKKKDIFDNSFLKFNLTFFKILFYYKKLKYIFKPNLYPIKYNQIKNYFIYLL